MTYSEYLLKKPRSLRTRIVLAFLGAYWALIFTGTHLTHLPRGMPRISDKLIHATAFFGLAFLLAWPMRRLLRSQARAVFWTMTCCIVYGVFDELTQMLVRNRTADFKDFLADCCGAVFGVVAFMTLRHMVVSRNELPSKPDKKELHFRSTDTM